MENLMEHCDLIFGFRFQFASIANIITKLEKTYKLGKKGKNTAKAVTLIRENNVFF
jgi:hypothetical protein